MLAMLFVFWYYFFLHTMMFLFAVGLGNFYPTVVSPRPPLGKTHNFVCCVAKQEKSPTKGTALLLVCFFFRGHCPIMWSIKIFWHLLISVTLFYVSRSCGWTSRFTPKSTDTNRCQTEKWGEDPRGPACEKPSNTRWAALVWRHQPLTTNTVHLQKLPVASCQTSALPSGVPE